jgi:hypothetical protein
VAANKSGDPDRIHARWCEDFKALSDEVHRLHLRSQIYEPIDEAIVTQQKPGSGIVISVLRTMYAEVQALCVRRLVDQRKGHRSLWRLLDLMSANPTVLSRRRYVALYQRVDDPNFEQYGNEEFDGIAGQGEHHIPKRVLVAFRDSVEASGRTVKTYVDERIAHNRPESDATLNFGQLKAAIHEISSTYQRVGALLNATHYEYEPVIQDPWEEVFSDPLFPDGKPPTSP